MRYKQIKKYIKSDCYRYIGKCDFFSMFIFYIKSSLFRWHVAFRMCHGKSFVKIIGLFLWLINKHRKDIVISRHLKVGYGLHLGHGGPIVVNHSVIIGNNCNFSQFVSIGSNFGKGAIINDNVYVGPNVSIVENVNIGNNSTIGAGSVVTKDVPDNATVAGNYAKVLNYNNPGRFIKNKWDLNGK